MTNEQKQIEEMAKIIDDRLIDARNWLGSMNRGEGHWIAEELVKHYQPKLPENMVVLDQEKYHLLINIKKFFETADSEISAGNFLVYLKEFKEEVQEEYQAKIDELEEEIDMLIKEQKEDRSYEIEQSCKERTREILCELYKFETHNAHPYFTLNKIEELAKKYDVEVEE